jgi:hypothetical protein
MGIFVFINLQLGKSESILNNMKTQGFSTVQKILLLGCALLTGVSCITKDQSGVKPLLGTSPVVEVPDTRVMAPEELLGSWQVFNLHIRFRDGETISMNHEVLDAYLDLNSSGDFLMETTKPAGYVQKLRGYLADVSLTSSEGDLHKDWLFFLVFESNEVEAGFVPEPREEFYYLRGDTLLRTVIIEPIHDPASVGYTESYTYLRVP